MNRRIDVNFSDLGVNDDSIFNSGDDIILGSNDSLNSVEQSGQSSSNSNEELQQSNKSLCFSQHGIEEEEEEKKEEILILPTEDEPKPALVINHTSDRNPDNPLLTQNRREHIRFLARLGNNREMYERPYFPRPEIVKADEASDVFEILNSEREELLRMKLLHLETLLLSFERVEVSDARTRLIRKKIKIQIWVTRGCLIHNFSHDLLELIGKQYAYIEAVPTHYDLPQLTLYEETKVRRHHLPDVLNVVTPIKLV